jgi:hypothetical protein
MSRYRLLATACALTLPVVALAPAIGGTVPASAARAAAAAATIPVPQKDPFYQPPAGYQSKAPGTILRSRPVQVAVFGILPESVQAWQVLFRTTAYNGAPMASVTTLLRPAGRAPRAVVSYQIAEDASAPQCAPSYELRLGINPGASANQAELLLIDALVGEDFAVSIPDYEGFEGDFGAPRQPGYVVLDGLRAAEQFKAIGLPGASTPAAIWGYSGGSLASGWAAQLQPSYAPQLNLRGVAVGGFLADPENTVSAINGGPFAGLLASTIPGVFKTNPSLAATTAKYLTPAGKSALTTGASQCEGQNVPQFAFGNMNNYLTIPLSSFLAIPAVKTALATLNLGSETPRAPLFVYQAVNDEIVPVSGVDAEVASYCAHGDSVTYTRDELSEHVTLAMIGAPDVLSWLVQRLEGGPVPRGCTTSTVPSMDLNWAALVNIPAFLIADILGLLDLPGGGGIV